MSFSPYLKYASSAVQWIGAIPAHWEVSKFRHLFHESSEKIEGEVVGPMLSVSGYRGIEVKEYDDENRRRLDEDLQGYRIVRIGQLVVNTMWLNYAGLGVSEFEGHVSPAYRCYTIADRLDRRFIHYLMRSSIYVQGYTQLLTGIRPNSLQMSRNDLMEFPILIPPKEEQSSIARFLDRETAKIDALVQEQQLLIELLQEKRQTVISHAVTKGLYPNAPMKDTAVEWLGQVPAHWIVKPLRTIASIVRGASPRPAGDPKYFGGDFIRWVTVAEITKDEDCDLWETQESLTEEGARHSRVFAPETVIYSNSGATLGVPKVLRVQACANDGVIGFLALSASVDRYFLYYFLASLTETIREMIRQGQGQPNLNTDIVKSIVLALPPIDEQIAIVKHIQRAREQIDLLGSISEEAIRLLQERRSALISAAVTGKIDVRGLASLEAEPAKVAAA